MSRRLGVAQTDLWRMNADGSGLERITFLSSSELSPAFMREGRVTMSTEKVDPADPAAGFYQISGRRGAHFRVCGARTIHCETRSHQQSEKNWDR